MFKNILFVSFLGIGILCGIDVGHLKENKIFYFFDSFNGCINRINPYKQEVKMLTIDKVPLFLTDFCWGSKPTYIFCEDKIIYKGTSKQIKSLLASPGRKCICIALQDESFSRSSHAITCIFPNWPGLNRVSQNANYDNNRGIMLFPLIPEKPNWYSHEKPVSIYTDFWDEFNNFIVGKSYTTIPFVSDKPGHLCIALPCLVNFYNDTLSFFCPMKNAGFSLNLKNISVSFSNQLYVKEEPKQCTFVMDVWSNKTQVKGVAVHLFK